MLAREVERKVPPGVSLVVSSIADLDITDASAVSGRVAQENPDWILNCAAYTRVDKAEDEPAVAFAVNAIGPANLASAARSSGTRLLHISTDYVFDGTGNRPYREDDLPNPLSVYGASKLAGELAVRWMLPEHHLIVRTQWLFGDGGPNFIDTILQLARTRSQIRVVDDQHGSPTAAADLAGALWGLVKLDARGTVHIASDGEATWYDLAREVVEAANLSCAVVRCSTEEFPRPARRPAYGVLDRSRYRELTGRSLRSWKSATREFVARQLAAV